MRRQIGFILLLLCFGCNQKTDNAINALSFKKLLYKSDEVVVTLYDSTVNKQQSRGVELWKPRQVFRLREKQLDDFKGLFDDARQTDYCCYPLSNYAIYFVNQADTLDIFYADTTQDSNHIQIYEGSYQYSFLVSRDRWKSLLAKAKP